MSEDSAVKFLFPRLFSPMFSSLAMASNKAFGFVVFCSAVVGNIVVSSGRTVVSLVFLDVPLVHDDDQPAARFPCERGDLQVLVVQSLGGVDQQQAGDFIGIQLAEGVLVEPADGMPHQQIGCPGRGGGVIMDAGPKAGPQSRGAAQGCKDGRDQNTLRRGVFEGPDGAGLDARVG